MNKRMKALRFIMTFCMIFSVFTPLATVQVAAAVVPVANETQLRDAVTNATVGTTIELTSNIQLTSSALTIPATKNVELTGSGYTLIGADGYNTIEVQGNLTLNGPTITHNTGKLGRGIYNNGGAFKMLEGKIINNSTAGDGGGVCVYYGFFEMSGGEITGNTAGENGGGVYNYNGNMFMTGGKITGNTAGRDGGGMYVWGSYSLQEVEISGNIAGGNGGGIYSCDPGVGNMERSKITNNTAEGSGGGVYFDNGRATITGNTIANNVAKADGGGVFNDAFDLNLDGTISGNSADNNGGGIYDIAGLRIYGTISDNHAGNDGGGIFTIVYNYINVPNGKTISFSKNTARYATNPAANDPIRTNHIDPSVTSFSTSFGTAFTNYDINYNNGSVPDDPKLSVVKKADKSTIVPGEKLSYTITVTNKGTVDIKDIVIKDYLPKYTSYDSSSPKGTLSKENGKDCVTWTIASLKAGKSFKINLTVIVDKDIPKGHSIENIVSYTGGDGENTVTGTSNTAVTTYDGKPQTGDTGSPSLLIVIAAAAVLMATAMAFPALRRKFKGCN